VEVAVSFKAGVKPDKVKTVTKSQEMHKNGAAELKRLFAFTNSVER
jgi:hypothetical protein